MTNKIVEILKYNNIEISNPIEKIHIAIGIIENLCHEVVYHKHSRINYGHMEKEVIQIVIKNFLEVSIMSRTKINKVYVENIEYSSISNQVKVTLLYHTY